MAGVTFMEKVNRTSAGKIKDGAIKKVKFTLKSFKATRNLNGFQYLDMRHLIKIVRKVKMSNLRQKCLMFRSFLPMISPKLS